MAHLVTFRSSKFDTSTETPNPINPIAGESVLLWLREQLRSSPYQAAAPAAEDWGWYMDVSGEGASYLVGASAAADEPSASVDWTIQIQRHRSVIDKVTGANRMTDDDPLSVLVEGIIRADPGSGDVEAEKDA
jgi:hypothetical protein